MTTKLLLTLANDIQEIPRLVTLVESFFKGHGVNSKLVLNVSLALDEVLTNIILHGYSDNSMHDINISLEFEQDMIKVIIDDDARKFDPRITPPPDIESPLETRPVGGLGVYLVKQLMDSVEYERSNGRNHLILLKFLSKETDL